MRTGFRNIAEAGYDGVEVMVTHDPATQDPHLLAQSFFRATEHPTEGQIREMAIPSRWSGATLEVVRPAPRLGEHSREVLKEAGLTDREIDNLIKARTTIATT